MKPTFGIETSGIRLAAAGQSPHYPASKLLMAVSNGEEDSQSQRDGDEERERLSGRLRAFRICTAVWVSYGSI